VGQQVVKVNRHKAASPSHMVSSIVFARWHQCAPHLIYLSQHPGSVRAESLWAHQLLDMSYASPLLPSKLPLHLDSVNTRFSGPTPFHIPNSIWTGSAVFAGLTIATDRSTNKPTDRVTDHATVCNNMPHVRSTAMRPNSHANVDSQGIGQLWRWLCESSPGSFNEFRLSARWLPTLKLSQLLPWVSWVYW